MKSPLSVCLSLYRRLANAYPHEFRMLYGEDLDRLGEDAVPEAWRRYGLFGLVKLLADIAVRLPAEYFAEVRQDVTYAFRVLARSPGFTAVGVCSLAIGIGMCGVVLSQSNAILGPPPGVRDPAGIFTPRRQVSYPHFENYRDQHRVVAAATAFLTSVPFAVAPTGEERQSGAHLWATGLARVFLDPGSDAGFGAFLFGGDREARHGSSGSSQRPILALAFEFGSAGRGARGAAERSVGHRCRHRAEGFSGYLGVESLGFVCSGDVRRFRGA